MVKFTSITFVILSLCVLQAQAQSPVLEKYVQMGLEANLGLQQQRLTYDKSVEAVRQNKGLYMPTLSAEARYTERYGNVIDFGQFINPVFSTLNTLTASNNFPTGVEVKLPLAQETKLKLTQPIFNPAIHFNYKLNKALAASTKAQTSATARQLVADIKTAYLNYNKTVRVVGLYEKTLNLLKENLRVSESLVANQRATADVVYTARAELSNVEQQKADAEKNRDLAQQFFNFLLNRDSDAAIELMVDSNIVSPFGANTIGEKNAQQQALTGREELNQLKFGIEASKQAVNVSRTNFLPTIGAAIETGIQGNYYNFKSTQNYTLASLQLQWNIFTGFQNSSKRKQALLETQRLRTREEELRQQINLQVRQAYKEGDVAWRAIATANSRLNAAEKSFQIIEKKYAQGVAPQIDYINARTAYTNAGINHIITVYDYFLKYVQLERAAALYTLQ